MFNINDFANGLSYMYKSFYEGSLNKRWIKHSDIIPVINFIKNKNIFSVSKAGESIQGRDIYLISYGKGEKKIFLWSQMHGDESTATMAIFDVLNFLSDNHHFNEIKDIILNQTKIYFMPMVNPDGAEIFQRRNSFQIDINRDAQSLQSAEAQILMKTFRDIKPHFGFNLHDQNIHYAAGDSFRSAAISLLAPPVDIENTFSESRQRAVKLVVDIYSLLNNFIPGHVGRYPDDFELRAFGDSFQKEGMSTILIESGGWKDDWDKQYIRKINFIILLTSFLNIAQENYKKAHLKLYDVVPENKEILFDLLLKNLKIINEGKELLIDIGINLEEFPGNSSQNIFYKGTITDIGDLSTFHGYNEIDLTGYEILSGKTYPDEIQTISELSKFDFLKLYSEGYTNVICSLNELKTQTVSFPVNIQSDKEFKKKIEIDGIADFIILKNNKVHYVVINGFLYNITTNSGEIKNGAKLG